MKYILTKNEIYEVHHEDDTWFYAIEKNNPNAYLLVYKEDVIKQADTIEELCDKFVYKKELYKKIAKGEDWENQTIIRLYGMSFFDLYIEEWNNIYGAIWTDKGLIYVAKMNDKGELELL